MSTSFQEAAELPSASSGRWRRDLPERRFVRSHGDLLGIQSFNAFFLLGSHVWCLFCPLPPLPLLPSFPRYLPLLIASLHLPSWSLPSTQQASASLEVSRSPSQISIPVDPSSNRGNPLPDTPHAAHTEFESVSVIEVCFPNPPIEDSSLLNRIRLRRTPSPPRYRSQVEGSVSLSWCSRVVLSGGSRGSVWIVVAWWARL